MTKQLAISPEHERCPCGLFSVDECQGADEFYAANDEPLLLHNNAGSPAAFADNPYYKAAFQRVKMPLLATYINPNDLQYPHEVVPKLRDVIAIREQIDDHLALTFWSGGYAFLQAFFPKLFPALTMFISGDFVGYLRTADCSKTCDKAATIPQLIEQISLMQPEAVAFTNIESNPSLIPINGVELAREIRRVSPKTIIILDDVYGRHAGNDLSVNKLALEDERLIYLRCASKDTGAVGLRMAWTITKPGGVMDNLLKSLHTPYEVSSIVASICAELYKHNDAIDEVVGKQCSARTWLTHHLRKEGIEVRAGKSPWVLIRPRIDADEATRKLATRNIHVQSQTGIHPSLSGYIRVSTTICAEMKRFFDTAKEEGVI